MAIQHQCISVAIIPLTLLMNHISRMGTYVLSTFLGSSIYNALLDCQASPLMISSEQRMPTASWGFLAVGAALAPACQVLLPLVSTTRSRWDYQRLCLTRSLMQTLPVLV